MTKRSLKFAMVSHTDHLSLTVRNYSNDPTLASAPYSVQLAKSILNFSSRVEGLGRALRRLGHEVVDLAYGGYHVSKRWALENNFAVEESQWKNSIFLEQLRRERVDVLYAQDASMFDPGFCQVIRQSCPTIKLLVVHKGFPAPIDGVGNYDLVLAGTPALYNEHRASGLNTHLVYHGFDADVLKQLPPVQQDVDFSFYGLSGFARGDSHFKRYWYLVKLLKESNIQLWVDEEIESEEEARTNAARKMAAYALNFMDKESIIRILRMGFMVSSEPEFRSFLEGIEATKASLLGYCDKALATPFPPPLVSLNYVFPVQCHDPVFGLDAYRVMQRSKLSFNVHTDKTPLAIGNMRLFEASGVHSCLLTDTSTNMRDLFEPDYELVTYSTIEECISKAKYLLENEQKRLEIAAAGHRRTMQNHTLDHRAQQIDEIIQKSLTSNSYAQSGMGA